MLYLPSVGFCILLARLLCMLFIRTNKKEVSSLFDSFCCWKLKCRTDWYYREHEPIVKTDMCRACVQVAVQIVDSSLKKFLRLCLCQCSSYNNETSIYKNKDQSGIDFGISQSYPLFDCVEAYKLHAPAGSKSRTHWQSCHHFYSPRLWLENCVSQHGLERWGHFTSVFPHGTRLLIVLI